MDQRRERRHCAPGGRGRVRFVVGGVVMGGEVEGVVVRFCEGDC